MRAIRGMMCSPGVLHDKTESAVAEHLEPARPGPTSAVAHSAADTTGAGDGPLAGRRVLVLGGSHELAAAARARVADLGGAAAVNLSGSVTDVLVLPEGDADRRMRRIASLGLPVHGEAWLGGLGAAKPPTVSMAVGRPAAAIVLVRGAVIDLPVTLNATRWTIIASWGQQTTCEVDMVAFVVSADEQVSSDDDFVFYGAPENPDGSVSLSTNGPTEQAITVDLPVLPSATGKVIIAAAIDGRNTFGDVGAVEIITGPGPNASPMAQATLDAATTERTMLLAEIYRRGQSWRLRAVGQGYDHGLDDLAREYGVDIDD